ncbi:MAG: type II toxin-antitoxin system HicA family toxin [Rhizonema sp. PD38]|nr:type II toxin-antitoxin system HicA family toxin [Rhizonema sp. PD38]
MGLNSKHQKTLNAIFENPVKSNISWNDIENMLIALGAEVSEGAGSRVIVVLNGIRAVFHRPHPEKEADKGAVKSVRRFLAEAGVTNDDL